jgi:predicted nucleotidyltransferase
MKEIIQSRLQEIENGQDVRIIHAVESGSRAWGFPSTDSDYDVRFIYAHRPQWYLSVDLERKRDVIEFPVDGDLDITGWDIRKALQLLYKSNPPLLEWFSSPIVYWTDRATIDPLQKLASNFFSPSACMHHYRRIAQQEYKKYIQSGNRQLKKYFYALRCVLAYRWVEQGLGIVPMPFEDLAAALVPSPELRQQITELIEVKRTSREMDSTPQMVELEEYVEKELGEIEKTQLNSSTIDGTIDELNEYFRTSLKMLWQNL